MMLKGGGSLLRDYSLSDYYNSIGPNHPDRPRRGVSEANSPEGVFCRRRRLSIF